MGRVIQKQILLLLLLWQHGNQSKSLDMLQLLLGLSVCLSVCHVVSAAENSEAIDQDTVCIWDSCGPRETPVAYSGPIRGEYYIVFIQHNTAI